jgi:hypothetical protein
MTVMPAYAPAIRPAKAAAQKPLTQDDIIMLKGKPYNIQRARMLIRNFIFIK